MNVFYNTVDSISEVVSGEFTYGEKSSSDFDSSDSAYDEYAFDHLVPNDVSGNRLFPETSPTELPWDIVLLIVDNADQSTAEMFRRTCKTTYDYILEIHGMNSISVDAAVRGYSSIYEYLERDCSESCMSTAIDANGDEFMIPSVGNTADLVVLRSPLHVVKEWIDKQLLSRHAARIAAEAGRVDVVELLATEGNYHDLMKIAIKDQCLPLFRLLRRKFPDVYISIADYRSGSLGHIFILGSTVEYLIKKDHCEIVDFIVKKGIHIKGNLLKLAPSVEMLKIICERHRSQSDHCENVKNCAAAAARRGRLDLLQYLSSVCKLSGRFLTYAVHYPHIVSWALSAGIKPPPGFYNLAVSVGAIETQEILEKAGLTSD